MTTVRAITREEAKPQDIIKQTKGKFFTVEFVKRTTGELRKMNCRTGVSKGVTGAGKTYDPEEKGLVTVWDTQAKSFRSISIEGIISVTADGVEWRWTYGIQG
mgnify:CR=1 FL=1